MNKHLKFILDSDKSFTKQNEVVLSGILGIYDK
jgi:hypothetical protein